MKKMNELEMRSVNGGFSLIALGACAALAAAGVAYGSWAYKYVKNNVKIGH